MAAGSGSIPPYIKVKFWVDNYGRGDLPDDRAVHVYMECETKEEVRSLQAELIAMAEGRYEDKTLDNLIGYKRRVKFESYQAWAKLMMQWIASFKG